MKKKLPMSKKWGGKKRKLPPLRALDPSYYAAQALMSLRKNLVMASRITDPTVITRMGMPGRHDQTWKEPY